MKITKEITKVFKDFRKYVGLFLTTLLIIALFGIIFVVLGIGDISQTSFWLELGAVFLITTQARLYWSDFYEKKTLEEDVKIVLAKENYNKRLDELDIDVYKFESFLNDLNEENRTYFYKNNTRHLTRENCKNYDKMIIKYKKERDKLRPITSGDILTKDSTTDLVDVKNRLNIRKYMYQTFSAVYTLISFILFGLVVFKYFEWSLENATRFLTYIVYIGFTMMMAINFTVSNTKKSTVSHLLRLQMVLDKYESWLKKGGDVNGTNNSSKKEFIGRDNTGTK